MKWEQSPLTGNIKYFLIIISNKFHHIFYLKKMVYKNEECVQTSKMQKSVLFKYHLRKKGIFFKISYNIFYIEIIKFNKKLFNKCNYQLI